MCDPITLTGAGIGLIFGGAMGAYDLFDRSNQQDELNRAIEDSYEQDLANAREVIAYKNQVQEEETRSKQMANAQDSRAAAIEAMQREASAEAAMSALNIAGNSVGHEVATWDVSRIRREGAYEARDEAITSEHMLGQTGLNLEYRSYMDQAYAKGMSNWQDILGSAWGNALGLVTGAASGALGGASIASAAGGAGLFGTTGTDAAGKGGVAGSWSKFAPSTQATAKTLTNQSALWGSMAGVTNTLIIKKR